VYRGKSVDAKKVRINLPHENHWFYILVSAVNSQTHYVHVVGPEINHTGIPVQSDRMPSFLVPCPRHAHEDPSAGVKNFHFYYSRRMVKGKLLPFVKAGMATLALLPDPKSNRSVELLCQNHFAGLLLQDAAFLFDAILKIIKKVLVYRECRFEAKFHFFHQFDHLFTINQFYWL
jgi:hypothetical protein